MASKKVLVIMGFFFVIMNIVVQSAPIEKKKQSFQSSSNDSKKAVNEPLRDSSSSEEKPALTSLKTTTTTTTTISSTTNSTNIHSQHSSINNIQEKKKRSTFIDQLDVPMNNENEYLTNDDIVDNDDEHVLHTNIKETSAQIHNNADKSVNIDDSRIYSDIQMTPFNWKTIRRRRQIQLNEQSTQRRKRALSPYEFFDTDSYYDPYEDLMEQEEYDRPMRSFAPLYWYPSVYRRTVRSDFVPLYYETSELPRLYSNVIEQEQDDDDDDDDDNYDNNNDNDELNESPVLLFDDDNDYESNHYPILVPSSNLALNNYDLQQQYNIDDLPIDENYQTNLNDNEDDDDDEQYGLYDSPYFSRYEPTDAYFSLRD